MNGLMITGDAMARPLIEALDAPGASRSRRRSSCSRRSAAVFSPSVKDEFFRHFPNLIMIDAVGSSEIGQERHRDGAEGQDRDEGRRPDGAHGRRHGRARREPRARRSRARASSASSRAAATSRSSTTRIPKKTRRDLRHRRGRPALRDARRLRDASRPTARSRCSAAARCRSTRAARRSIPEEVESAIKSHPDVLRRHRRRRARRALGRARRRGRRRPRAGQHADARRACRRTAARKIAGYKVPRELHLVEQIERSPSGKPDYRWAKTVATGGA